MHFVAVRMLYSIWRSDQFKIRRGPLVNALSYILYRLLHATYVRLFFLSKQYWQSFLAHRVLANCIWLQDERDLRSEVMINFISPRYRYYEYLAIFCTGRCMHKFRNTQLNLIISTQSSMAK